MRRGGGAHLLKSIHSFPIDQRIKNVTLPTIKNIILPHFSASSCVKRSSPIFSKNIQKNESMFMICKTRYSIEIRKSQSLRMVKLTFLVYQAMLKIGNLYLRRLESKWVKLIFFTDRVWCEFLSYNGIICSVPQGTRLKFQVENLCNKWC